MPTVFKKLKILFFLCFGVLSYAQEHIENHETTHKHSIGLLISHSTIFEGIESGEKSTISVPSWAINYNYIFNVKWSIGLHNDIIIENFLIEKTSDGEVIERKTPITSIIVGTYKITEHFGIELGAGMEFEREENFGVARLGAEYSIEIPKHNLEVLFGLDYDFVFGAYNTLNIGFGLAKLF